MLYLSSLERLQVRTWIIVIFSCVASVLGSDPVDDGTGILPEPGISGIQRRGAGRETGRPGPVLEEEKDWEITMDQFSSIISNLNLLQMFIFLYIYYVYISVNLGVKTSKIFWYVWEMTSGILA